VSCPSPESPTPRSGESRASDLYVTSAVVATSALARRRGNAASVTRDSFPLGAGGSIDRN
jgi:hypothetical protein